MRTDDKESVYKMSRKELNQHLEQTGWELEISSKQTVLFDVARCSIYVWQVYCVA